MIENILTATPAEVDGQLQNLYGQAAQLENARDRARRIQRDKYCAAAEFMKADAIIADAADKLVVLGALITALDSEYRRRRWTRYYMVDNNNGHLHTSTHCSTCYDSTDFYWMTEMSGLTHAEAVALAGGLSCLACFPGLREIIEENRPCRIETPNQAKSREEREAVAAVKAEKQAKATANGIIAPDGSPLLDEDGYAIKTLRTAQIKAVDALEQSGLDGIYADQAETESHAAQLMEMSRRDREYAIRLIKAIAVKQERPLADVLDELIAKADKKLAPARKDEEARKAAGQTAAEWYRTNR